MKTILVMYDEYLKPGTEAPAKEAIEYLRKKGCNVEVSNRALLDTWTFSLVETKPIDAIMVYGGDGLLLHVANQVTKHSIPLIGVNYGRVGYLCVDRHMNCFALWDAIIEGNYHIEQRTRIMAKIEHSKERSTNRTTIGFTETIDALNEISIGGIDKTVYLNLFITPYPINRIEAIGDGIIFATKTGSTAYNVNAGGAVLLTDAFSVVANNCLFQGEKLPINTKALVTNVNTRFEVEILNKKAENLPYLVADGQRRVKLIGDEKIIIEKSNYQTLFMVL